MIFLSLACDNIFMFKDFYIDFTYDRKINHFLSEHDAIFPESNINVRKKMLLLGGNASGKTTFGILLCAISNFIIGMPISNSRLNLYNAIFDKNKDSKFSVDFVCDHDAYRLECIFNSNGIKKEEWRKVKVYKSYNIKKLRQQLDSAKVISLFTNNDSEQISTLQQRVFVSNIMSRYNLANKKLQALLSGIGFHYFFSNYSDQNSDNKINTSVDMINNILPVIDNSVDKVVALQPDDKQLKTTSYLISFKNGEQLTIPDGDLSSVAQDRLSHGTYEVLSFLSILQEVKYRRTHTIYIDEKLPHLHAELEAYLVIKLLLINRDAQIFFTTHNSELLDLNVPSNTFLLFKRGDDGYNTAIFVNEKLNKNDRSIRNYYENDYFGVMPDYTSLDVYFEDACHE